MTGIFRTNNPLNSFLLFVYGLLLKFIWFLHPQIPVVQKPNGFLFNDMVTLVKPYLTLYPSSYFFIAYLLIYTQAISFNQLIMRRRMMQKPNYLPAMSYLLITSFLTEWNVLSAPMIINTLLIWIWAKISNLNNNEHPKSTLFNAGIVIGICAFLYLPSFTFAVFIIFSLIISRPPKPAEMFINIIGIITPWYFLASWLFLTNRLYSFSLSGMGVTSPSFQPVSITLMALILILLLTIAGVFIVQSVSSKQIIQVRKNWKLMLLYLAIAMAALFVDNIHHVEYWLLALVPVSVFVGYVFYFTRVKWLSALLHWLMVAFILYSQYFHK
ncbi:MAG: DUF6427 family protein [Ginsengibacter sp.]